MNITHRQRSKTRAQSTMLLSPHPRVCVLSVCPSTPQVHHTVLSLTAWSVCWEGCYDTRLVLQPDSLVSLFYFILSITDVMIVLLFTRHYVKSNFIRQGTQSDVFITRQSKINRIMFHCHLCQTTTYS